jgi:hypothetical protein
LGKKSSTILIFPIGPFVYLTLCFFIFTRIPLKNRYIHAEILSLSAEKHGPLGP